MRDKLTLRTVRKKRVRAKISGTTEKPRLSVYRSNAHVFAQLIDDTNHSVICAVSDKKFDEKMTKTDKAFKLGKELAVLAKTKKVEKIVFDRSGYRYHGRIKAIAEGARDGGLIF